MKTIAQKIGMAKEEPKEVSGIAKPFPSDAPTRMHKKYYENNIGQIKKIYKEQGMELPNYFGSASDYAEYRKSQKMYGGKVQPRGAMRSTETR